MNLFFNPSLFTILGKRLGYFLIIIYPFSDLFGQQPVFQKSFIINNQVNAHRDMKHCYDKGFIIPIGSDSLGGGGLLKLDSSGNHTWLTWWDNNPNIYAAFSVVGLCRDSNFIVAGNYSIPFTVFDAFLSKINKNGSIIWSKAYAQSPNDTVRAFDRPVELASGNFIVLGSQVKSFPNSFSSPILACMDSVGNILWCKSYYASNDTSITWTNMIVSNDSHIVLAGGIGYPVNKGGGLLTKMDLQGNVIWTKYYADTVMSPGGIEACKQSPDGGYIACGQKNGIYIFKTDSLGIQQWSRIYYNGGFTYAWDIEVTSDGGFVISGSTYPAGQPYDCMYLLKLDSAGNVQWSKYYKIGVANSVEVTLGGGYMLLDRWTIQLVKTDSLGNAGCNTYDLTPLTGYISLPVSTTPVTILTDTVVFTATYTINGGVFDTMQDTIFCYGFSGIEEDHKKRDELFIYPNPTTGNFQIKYSLPQNESGTIEIFDVNGKGVYSQMLPKGSTMQMIRLPEIADGIYSCVLSTITSKMFKKLAVISD